MDDLGFAKSLAAEEIGGTLVVRLEQDEAAGRVSTVVLRAATDQLLDDLERAVDDGVNTYKVRARFVLRLYASKHSKRQAQTHMVTRCWSHGHWQASANRHS